jgi:LacI family transcriptional regulator
VSTLQEIADIAGVSLNTASRVLSGRIKGVRRDAVERSELILKIAQDLNYRPNTSAKAIRCGRFGGIALLLSTTQSRSHIPAGLLEGIESVLLPHDLHLTFTRLPDDSLTHQGVVPKILRQSMTDGMLVNYTHHIPSKMVKLIENERIPSVWLNTKRDRDCVRPDDLRAARQATERLLALGHRRIAYVDLSSDDHATKACHYSVADRLAGYSAAMEAAGLTPQIVTQDRDVLPAERIGLAAEFLQRPDRPTAVVAYAPWTALPVLLAAATVCRLEVPRDLSIMTFSDVTDDRAGIALSSMLLPTAEIGTVATEMLLQKIESPRSSFAEKAVPFAEGEGHTIGPLAAG